MQFHLSNRVKWPGVCAALLVLLVSVLFVPTQRSQVLRNTQQSEREGKRKISLGSEVPKEIKLIAIRNYDSDDWYKTFECEIENQSKKDIWFIHFQLILPQFDRGDRRSALLMKFGDTNPSLGGINNPNKPLLRPGGRYVFKVPEYQIENLKKRHSDGIHVPLITHLSLDFYKIFFTDGTGYLKGKPIVLEPDGGLRSVIPNKLSSRP